MANEPIITVIGNLTSDPDIKYVSSGTAVASFTVASTPRTYNKTTDEWEDGEPMFVRCSVWRDYAENVAESLSKGTRVVVHGRLQVRSYQRNDGSQGTSIEMQVDEVGPSLRYATATITKSGAGGSQTRQQGNSGTHAYPSNSDAPQANPWNAEAPF